ncbi:hypothetical protein [Agrobacterium sp.]|uniref:hypothetical protein n=1 Tax=Agrobacterium sp. TaxID=361 RepID=UPI0028AC3859|nr:hypothetical protein [Agrobacterium sp.]
MSPPFVMDKSAPQGFCLISRKRPGVDKPYLGVFILLIKSITARQQGWLHEHIDVIANSTYPHPRIDMVDFHGPVLP